MFHEVQTNAPLTPATCNKEIYYNQYFYELRPEYNTAFIER